ncbi:MAG: MFS transporter [Gammaproteobacteria bacterium]|nr:MFS transporter [Chromatiales bacterium]MDP6675585.1 MFS transporter [Gammaproteobacteria bacterium]
MARYWSQRSVIGWALYDWANSAFTLTVVTVFFPVLLADFWSDGVDSTVTTFRLGMANGVASLIVAVSAPLLGAIADRLGRRKGLLCLLAALGIVMTGALFFVTRGQWPLAIACYVLASIGFAGSNSLYDALLVDVAPAEQFHQVSALGYGLGYLGGSLLFMLNIWMVSSPATFGLGSEVAAIRLAFILVALWWVIFSLPLLFWVREREELHEHRPVMEGVLLFIDTFRKITHDKNLVLFLAAYWLYIDGVYTIIKMAVDYGLSQGLSMQDLIRAILVTNLIGFPAALLFGRLGLSIGARSGLYVGIGVYFIITTAAVFITTAVEFYVLAACIGLVQGGVQSLSRSLFAHLIPADSSAAYFGFYNMLGKFSAVLGPVLIGFVTLTSGSQRLGILSIIVLFGLGLILLTRVNPRPV